MLSLLSGLLGLLPTISNTINSITNAISNEKIAQINATDDEDKARIEERIKTLEAKRDVLVAETGHSNIDLWIRVLLSAGPATYLTKIFIWDEVLGLGSTPDVSNNLWQVVTAVIGFYFLYSGAMGVTRVLKS
jgi:predicted PolB exonuclease-like 3'-5' exonuclease